MRKAVIWDLDGTLFDSYDVIVESIDLALKEHGILMNVEQIHHYAIAFSIKALFAKASAKYGVSPSLYVTTVTSWPSFISLCDKSYTTLAMPPTTLGGYSHVSINIFIDLPLS